MGGEGDLGEGGSMYKGTYAAWGGTRRGSRPPCIMCAAGPAPATKSIDGAD